MTNRTKAILSLGSVFLIGTLCGALIVGIIVRDHVQTAESLRQREGFLRHFERELDLSEAQRDSLADELRYVYERMYELRRSTSEEYSALLDTLHQTIYPKLRPEQQELFARQEERMRHGFPVPPGERGRMGRKMPPPPVGEVAPPDGGSDEKMSPEGRPPVLERRGTDSGSRRLSKNPPPANGQQSPPAAAHSESVSPDGETKPGEIPNPLKHDGKFEKHLERLRKHLSLSDEQMTAIRQVVEDARSKFHSGEKTFGDDPLRRRMMHRELSRDVKRNIVSILTPEQRVKMMELMGRHHDRDTSRGR